MCTKLTANYFTKKRLTTFMPTKKVKSEHKAAKRAQARKHDLATMRAKLAAGAEGAGGPDLPPASVLLRKSLKNRTEI
jgi:hypothetical protein